MIIKLLYILIIVLFTNISCVNGPAVIKSYDYEKGNNPDLILYRLIIEGDQYDPYLEQSVLDKVRLHFLNTGFDVRVSDDVFKNDFDTIRRGVDIGESQVGLVLIIRIKDLGFSFASLSNEKNVFINSIIYDNSGESLHNSIYSRTVSYFTSDTKRLDMDINNGLRRANRFLRVYKKSKG